MDNAATTQLTLNNSLKMIMDLRKTKSLVEIRKILSARGPENDGPQRKAV